MAQHRKAKSKAVKTKQPTKSKSTRPVRVLNSRKQFKLTIVIKKPQFKKTKKRVKKLVKQVRKQKLKDNVITGCLILVAFLCFTYLITSQFGPYLFAKQQTITSILPPKVAVNKVKDLSRSEPIRLRIPSIELDSELITLGKNPDGTLEVPVRTDIAGWYKHAPTPGEIGPAIITGHLNNYSSWNGIFSKLSHIAPGQMIEVLRADGANVQFKVDQVVQVSQNDFPTDAIYGNISYPGLRLITCGGTYNYLAGRYSENTVVFATMVDLAK